MKKLKYIKNISGQNLIINNININNNQIIDIYTNNSTSFKSTKGFNDMIKYNSTNFLDFYDYNFNIMSNDEFIDFFNYYNNKFLNLNKYYKIYEFLSDDAIPRFYDYSLCPKSLDYMNDVEIRFARKETFTRGFLTNVEYFESSTMGANGVTYFSNPILNVNIKYYVNSIGYVSYRETIRKWQTMDNNYSNDKKITLKQYNGVMSREEAIQRRNNIINQLILDIVNITYVYYYPTKTMDEIELMVLPLLDALENDVNKYLKGNLQPLIVNVSNASNVTYPWLDIIVEGSTTLHDYIENKLLEAILTEGMYTSTEPS